MSLRPLFQYVDRLNIEQLQKLKDGITSHGVLYTNDFGEIESQPTRDKDLLEKALGIVKTAITELHKDHSSDHSRHPDYEKQFADTQPNMFFVEIDGDGNYVPPSNSTKLPPPSTPRDSKTPRDTNASLLISGFLLKYYLDNNINALGLQKPTEEEMRDIQNYSRLILEIKKALKIEDGHVTYATFSANIKKICAHFEKVFPSKHDL